MKSIYYVYRDGDKIYRVARIDNGSLAYGYEGGKWVYMPSLIKIQNEITDYEEISEDEANKLIEELNTYDN